LLINTIKCASKWNSNKKNLNFFLFHVKRRKNESTFKSAILIYFIVFLLYSTYNLFSSNHLESVYFLLSESELIDLRLISGNCNIIKFKPVIIIVLSSIQKFRKGILNFYKWYPKAVIFILIDVFCFDFCNIVVRFVCKVERLCLNAELKMNWCKIIADWRRTKNLSFTTFIIWIITTSWIKDDFIVKISNKFGLYLIIRNQAY